MNYYKIEKFKPEKHTFYRITIYNFNKTVLEKFVTFSQKQAMKLIKIYAGEFFKGYYEKIK